jgi:hypothetical protein
MGGRGNCGDGIQSPCCSILNAGAPGRMAGAARGRAGARRGRAGARRRGAGAARREEGARRREAGAAHEGQARGAGGQALRAGMKARCAGRKARCAGRQARGAGRKYSPACTGAARVLGHATRFSGSRRIPITANCADGRRNLRAQLKSRMQCPMKRSANARGAAMDPMANDRPRRTAPLHSRSNQSAAVGQTFKLSSKPRVGAFLPPERIRISSGGQECPPLIDSMTD